MPLPATLSVRAAAEFDCFVPEADLIAVGDELLGQAVQRKNNEQHPASNVDVFFEHQWVSFFY